jgi:drug/metabolite transporter (DMT)-like permease
VVATVVVVRELDPFWSAASRLILASTVLWLLAASRLEVLPKGRALAMTAIFGLLNFCTTYAFVYWSAQAVPAGVLAIISSSIPLLTVFFAAAHRIERLSTQAVAGAMLAVIGILLMSSGKLAGEVGIAPLLAIVVAAAAAAEGSVVLKMIPGADPLMTNAVAVSIGGLVLLCLSRVTGERWALPDSAPVWWAMAYLVFASPMVFVLYAFVVKRWTASAASFQFVLFPVVAVTLGTVLLDEPLTGVFFVGAPLVLIGVYVGALRRRSEVVERRRLS